MANFSYRLKRLRQRVAGVQPFGKIAGAVGNYNAHYASYPDVHWESVAEEFVTSLGVSFNPYTTQVRFGLLRSGPSAPFPQLLCHQCPMD